MGTVLIILAAIFLVAAAVGVILALQLSGASDRPAVAERRRRLLVRLAAPALGVAVVLILLWRFAL